MIEGKFQMEFALVRCCFSGILLVVGLFLYFFVSVGKIKRAEKKVEQELPTQLGLTPLNITGAQDTWYGGIYQGHKIAISFAKLWTHSANFRGGRSAEVQLCIVVAVAANEPMSGFVMGYKYHNNAKPPDTFEEAFKTENAGNLSPAARAAMLAFVRKGALDSLRDLSLWGQADFLHQFRTAPTALGNLLLEHRIKQYADVTPESVRGVLDEMLGIARLIEETG